MMAEYWQEGKNLDYINKSGNLIPANTVIDLESMVGVAGADIPDGETGAVVVHGVFVMSKTGIAEISQGQKVYFDGTGITDVEATNTLAGNAAAEAGASDKTILVKLLG